MDIVRICPTARRMHTQGELDFRDFSSLSLVKENRRHLGNPACCISIDDYRRQFEAGNFDVIIC